MVEEQAASSETLDVDFQRALGPGPRIVDDAKVPDRPSRDDRPLIAAFTFVACFYMGLGGFLRLSRTALMDPVDV
jgi:uncharacterized protein involved in exopolysaccharide biosynthesis